MIYIKINYTKNNIPILSVNQIEDAAESCLRQFQPTALEKLQAVNIDNFAEIYLKLNIDYQHLSNDLSILGMTVFNNTNNLPVYNPKLNRAEYISADSGTIIIDSELTSTNKINRYRFTLAHECGHWIFHQKYYGYDPNQLSLFDDGDVPFTQCRQIKHHNYFKKTDNDWMEWQADKFAAALLMPKSTIINYYKLHYNPNLINNHVVDTISNTLKVSKEAATYRLKELNIINTENSVQPLLF